MKDFIGNLVLWKKFALIGALAVAMVVPPSMLLVRDAWESLSAAQAEYAGVAPAGDVLRLIQLTQQHRGLSAGVLGGAEGDKLRANKQAEVESALSQVMASSPRLKDKALSALSEEVQRDWGVLVEGVSGETLSGEGSNQLHTALIGKQLDLLQAIVDVSTLALDPQAKSYYLINAALVHLPRMTEYMGRARGGGTFVLSKRKAPPEELALIGGLSDGVRTYFRAAHNALNKAVQANPIASRKNFERQVSAALAAAEFAIKLVDERIVHAAALDYDPFQFFDEMTRAIDTQFALITDVSKDLRAMLADRVTQMHNDLLTVAGLAAGFGSLALWVIVVVSRSITRSIARALRIAQTVAAGDLSSHIEVVNTDETGSLLQALKAMNESLRVSEERFRALAGLSIDLYWEQDKNYRFTQISGESETFAGFKVAQHIGKTRWELGSVGMSDADWQAHREQLDRHELFKDFEVKRLSENGVLCMFTTSGTPIFDASGDFVGYRGVARDVTDRLIVDASLHELEAQLRESQKMESIGTLAGGIAHDFNNILGAILGNVALIRGDLGEGHSALASLQQINKAGLRARSLVQQILAFSRKQPQKLVNQPMRPRVEEALALLRATLPAGVNLEASLIDTPLYVLADATQLQQVLMNLCTNAWHALPHGTGHIGVCLDSVEFGPSTQNPGALQPGTYAHLWVRDDGAGMDDATRARIFEPFYTTKPVGQGTGLGLSVVHGIVSAHQGAISVDSAPGMGSTFHLYFPLLDDQSDTGSSGWGALDQKHGQGQHIVYIDDDEVMLVMAQQLLQRLQYKVTCYNDGHEAIAEIRSQPESFDLVVTDFNMPQVSGLDVARELAHIRSDLPVVISSGYVSEEMCAEAMRCGVHSVLQKENTVDELGALVQRIFSEVAA